MLASLPTSRFELSNSKTAAVQFNYHISVGGILYSVPYEYIQKKVDVKVTDTTIEIFYNLNRIASHCRMKGRPEKHNTVTEHMPEYHQKYLEWNGDRFRKSEASLEAACKKALSYTTLPRYNSIKNILVAGSVKQ